MHNAVVAAPPWREAYDRPFHPPPETTMQPTLFTATYSASRAAEAPRPAAAPLRIPRKKPAVLAAIAVATAGSFRSMRSMTTARSR